MSTHPTPRGFQYVRLPEPVNLLVNPAQVRTVVPQRDNKVAITYGSILYGEENVIYRGTIDGWLRAVRYLNVNPTIPVVDLDPEFVFAAGEEPEPEAKYV